MDSHKTINKWFSVADITSLTLEEANLRQELAVSEQVLENFKTKVRPYPMICYLSFSCVHCLLENKLAFYIDFQDDYYHTDDVNVKRHSSEPDPMDLPSRDSNESIYIYI